MDKILALFPGQGSQLVGMGKAFYEAETEARKVFDEADDALGFKLSSLCFEGPLEQLTLTHNAQPAILTASFAAFTLSGIQPVAAAGHSLGEYTALVAAGAMKFSDAVKLVHKRGRYMQEAVPAEEGKMIAVLGPTPEEIKEAIDLSPPGVREIANLNCPGQTVVAGDVKGIDGLSAVLKERGAKVVPLNVSAPFHCSLMKPAAEQLSVDLDAVAISAPKFPVYSNVTAQPVTSADEVRLRLKEQVCAPVRWTDSMLNAIAAHGPTRMVEFGAGKVLSNLMKRIKSDLPRADVCDPETLKSLNK